MKRKKRNRKEKDTFLKENMSVDPFRNLKLREGHYAEYFGPIDRTNAVSLNYYREPPIDVYFWHPDEFRPHCTLITSGMSDVRQNPPKGCDIGPRTELIFYAPEYDPWISCLLMEIAHWPFTKGTYYCPWHLFQFTKEKLAAYVGAGFEAVVFFPCVEHPRFNTMKVDGEPVEFLQVVPITAKELEFAGKYKSPKALFDLFIEFGVDPVFDRNRKSVV